MTRTYMWKTLQHETVTLYILQILLHREKARNKNLKNRVKNLKEKTNLANLRSNIRTKC